MKMRYLTIVLAIAAWISLGLLIGHQHAQETPLSLWDAIFRYALVGFALVATFIASKHTARNG